MSATLFTLFEFLLFFGFIIAAGIWQLRELDRDAKALEEERTEPTDETTGPAAR